MDLCSIYVETGGSVSLFVALKSLIHGSGVGHARAWLCSPVVIMRPEGV